MGEWPRWSAVMWTNRTDVGAAGWAVTKLATGNLLPGHYSVLLLIETVGEEMVHDSCMHVYSHGV
jgi:hypothetical protein